jgi:NAD(P)H-hydrate epimerase
VARAIELVRDADRPIVSLDLPSGLGSDGGELLGPTVRAGLTVTFAGYKRSLLLHPAAACAGRVVVVGIGIPPEEVARGIDTFLLEEADARAPFPPRPVDSHKGTYGHVLIVAGSLGKTGAAALAGHAALRGGVGLCTIAAPRSQQPIVAVMSREAMTEPLEETGAGAIALSAAARILGLASRTDAVALGPGLSLDEETQALVRKLVADVPRPMVVDADALTALAGHLDLLDGAAAPRVLTPHPGEMARMLGTTIAAVQSDRIETARTFASRHRACVALKGVNTVIAGPDGRVLVNPTGNPGMATGGSGDSLTGLSGAFLARRLDPFSALASACYLHGRAGDLAAAARGEEGLIAGDIADAIGAAMRHPETDRFR